ncbi:hypothetical protein K432DRAFT_406209 [Lepidopterella palustris CBS 459.81]|uniref:Ataxin-10 homolog n=1 Tax=Lepidopterella palustris CBS 459.81 TaxID=1314670 RepID=A0A8E2JDU7_9PEZI|nr:hypothetical protein K432DRAFT_406209 [Lepidopterella palustris CBS 459.81]
MPAIPESPLDESSTVSPYVTRFRLALAPWTVHFKYPGYVRDDTMHVLEINVCKKTLEGTRNSAEVREEIGSEPQVWKELGELLEAAVPSLEKRCFAAPDPATPEYEGLSGPLIASYSSSLLKDLERLNIIVSITRNVLTTGEKAQNLAAKLQFDQEVFKLISVCVKVTARGYDGEAGAADEDKWQSVINSFKKLLITCLQFLNNLVARNERRKLMLWVELFDSTTDSVLPHSRSGMFNKPELWPQLNDESKNHSSTSPNRQPDQPRPVWPDMPSTMTQQPASSPFLLYIGKMGMEVKRDLVEQGAKAGATEIAAECKKRWQSMSEEEKNKWNTLYADIIAKHRDELTASSAYRTVVDQHAKNEENVQALARSINQLQIEVDRMRKSVIASSKAAAEAEDKSQSGFDDLRNGAPPSPLKEIHPYIPITAEAPDAPPANEADFRMSYAASYGAEILQQGKDDLMKRLETYSERPSVAQANHVASPSSPVISPSSPIAANSAEEGAVAGSDEEDSEDEDYVVPGDDGRGLLTDVPLILGPTEIEVLPMIIMSGIVPPAAGTIGYGSSPDEIIAIRNMHTVRCHLLLAQDNGRNLLRELLIFVAAWDLREEELYFKFMVKIMEAILTNGLMPFSYHAFREYASPPTGRSFEHAAYASCYRSKDIISPAQAVIMKLLTNIFRARQSLQTSQSISKTGSREAGKEGADSYPMRVDVLMVNFLLTEFRRHIIPQTCALIFLQGQIRAGHAHPEDFPLNLWDMERMYEGVYQYLEFFAILTEHEVWKNMMADWEITSELVTLLKELDAAIPKGQVAPLASSSGRNVPRSTNSDGSISHNDAVSADTVPVAVERPYDIAQAQQAVGSGLPNPAVPETYVPEPRPYLDESQDEPSDFEWRNLKKLAVLVLSSLVWKSRKVQDQVRPLGGIEAILNCCTYDEHNPYIREHAIMCLRFLMEGNRENQSCVRDLEPKGCVPNEVLDQHGYETYMDSKGQVLLRRKDGGKVAGLGGSGSGAGSGVGGSGVSVGGKGMGQGLKAKDPRDLEVLVQQVMRELPTRVNGTKFDKEKAAALAKLDKGFDGKG